MSPSTVPAAPQPLNRPSGGSAGASAPPASPAGSPPPAPPHDLTAHLTDDLFLGAYLVAEGAQLAGTELESRPGRARKVCFVIEAAADELAVLESAYAEGEARTNVLRFKAALSHLKDVMFARLREPTRRASVDRLPVDRRPADRLPVGRTRASSRRR